MNLFNYSEKDLYELAKQQGDKKFGSECKHGQVKNGTCTNCLRKVKT